MALSVVLEFLIGLKALASLAVSVIQEREEISFLAIHQVIKHTPFKVFQKLLVYSSTVRVSVVMNEDDSRNEHFSFVLDKSP